MIIDVHGHIVAPPEMYAYQSILIGSRANPVGSPPKISDEVLRSYTQKNIDVLDKFGTDMQFISPRPYQMMHSIKPSRAVRKWTSFVNDTIARQVAMFPDRLKGVAGLPQSPGEDLKACVEELERAVKELGFIGCLLNPDPTEGAATPPGLGDEYWYPLYEKMVELDVPALVHSTSCCSARESYTLHFINEASIAVMSLLESRVFEDFPKLKIMISHSGGAIPYHMGRFRAWRFRTPGAERFDDSIKKLYFETCNYSQESLELLLKVIGPDNVLFGTENPGTGSFVDPDTGKQLDDLKPVIEGIGFLSAEDRKKVFESNAKKLFNLKL